MPETRGYVLIANERGRHGFDIVGLFDTEEEAVAFSRKHKLSEWSSGPSVKPLVAPENWKPNDGSMDDESQEQIV